MIVNVQGGATKEAKVNADQISGNRPTLNGCGMRCFACGKSNICPQNRNENLQPANFDIHQTHYKVDKC